MSMELTNLHTESEQTTASRSRLYQLLSMAFAFPDEDFFAAIGDGSFAVAIARACAGLPYDLTAAATLDLGDGGESYTELSFGLAELYEDPLVASALHTSPTKERRACPPKRAGSDPS